MAEMFSRLLADFVTINSNAYNQISFFLSEHLAFAILILTAAVTTCLYLKEEISVTVREERTIT